LPAVFRVSRAPWPAVDLQLSKWKSRNSWKSARTPDPKTDSYRPDELWTEFKCLWGYFYSMVAPKTQWKRQAGCRRCSAHVSCSKTAARIMTSSRCRSLLHGRKKPLVEG